MLRVCSRKTVISLGGIEARRLLNSSTMKIARALSSLLAGSLLVGVLTTTSGCLVGVRGGATVAYDVDAEPPPPRRIVVEDRPGYVWIDGYWYWNGGQWVWSDGRYEPRRDGYVYIQGNWGYQGGRHHWTPGHWERGGGGYEYDRGNRGIPAGDMMGRHREERHEERREERHEERREERREEHRENKGKVKVRDHSH